MIILYHGDPSLVEKPQIIKTKFTRDFSWGFYCTNIEKQAARWATRKSPRGVISTYELFEEDCTELRKLSFSEMTDDWLNFIAVCRSGKHHEFDIVEGPVADDTIYNYVQDYLDGKISKKAFWALAEFKKPTHQICFSTEAAIKKLKFVGGHNAL